jgi:hypothetical protein
MAHNTRIMFFENKETGQAWIGRASFSKSGKTIYYKDLAFIRSGGQGILGNYYAYDRKAYEEEQNAPWDGVSYHRKGYKGEFWISGPKKNGQDRQDGGRVTIDQDVAEEYWRDIREQI